MTRILGIDLITGSYAKPEIQFAACLYDSLNQDTQTFEKIGDSRLLEFIQDQTLDILIVDHVQELLHSPKLIEYLSDCQFPQVRQLNNNTAHSEKVHDLARRTGISLRKKPDALKTAIVCTLLAEKNGIPIKFWRDGSEIKFSVIQQQGSDHKNILDIKIRGEPKETTHRSAYRELGESPYVKKLENVIGYGKEAIVYHAKDIYDRDIIGKLFKTYSSIAKRIHTETYKAKAGHIPLIMARDEAKYLKMLAENDIPVPELYFRDDAMVGMEYISTTDGLLAPTLAEIDAKEVSLIEIEDLLYQTLDILYSMSKEAKIIHGDYSANNILVSDGSIVVIDVSQAMQINTNTFVNTPLRLRMDNAMDHIFRDLDGILTFFEKHFRIEVDRRTIFDSFLEIIPEIFFDKVSFITAKWSEKFNQ